MVISLSLVAPEPFSLLFGASRAFSFLACLVPLRWAKAWLCHSKKQKQTSKLVIAFYSQQKHVFPSQSRIQKVATNLICVSYKTPNYICDLSKTNK